MLHECKLGNRSQISKQSTVFSEYLFAIDQQLIKCHLVIWEDTHFQLSCHSNSKDWNKPLWLFYMTLFTLIQTW
jgi:hypothetical protein